jgi:hypothetical protein
MTRRKRKKDRSFEDTFDRIMTHTIGLICFLAVAAMFTALYLMVALIDTL